MNEPQPRGAREDVGADQVRFVTDQRIARPDLYIQIQDQIAEGDRVATRWRATGRTLNSLVPTARADPSSHCAGITIIRLLAGMQVDAHTHYTLPGDASRTLTPQPLTELERTSPEDPPRFAARSRAPAAPACSEGINPVK